MGGRHPDIHHHHIGVGFAHQRKQLDGVADLADDGEPERSSRLAKPSRSRVSSSATTARSGAGAVPDSAVLVSVVNALSSQDAA